MTMSFAHGATPVDARGKGVRRPRVLNLFSVSICVFLRACAVLCNMNAIQLTFTRRGLQIEHFLWQLILLRLNLSCVEKPVGD